MKCQNCVSWHTLESLGEYQRTLGVAPKDSLLPSAVLSWFGDMDTVLRRHSMILGESQATASQYDALQKAFARTRDLIQKFHKKIDATSAKASLSSDRNQLILDTRFDDGPAESSYEEATI